MILGTFSRVFEENRISQISDMYDLDSNLIESLAVPLAGSIRRRLGPEPDWRSVLRELTFISVRFNHVYPEPKFDLDIILLVGPAVLAHFDQDVAAREIHAVLQSNYEERELEEFEAFLNRTVDLFEDEQTVGIDWDAMYGPLNAVASAVAAQREQWAQGRSKITHQYLLAPPTAEQPPDPGFYLAGAVSPSSPALPQTAGYKTFDIAVSPDLSTQVESLFRVVYPLSDNASVKTRMQPFIPVITGVLVILLIVLGSMMVSGNWNSPLPAVNNSSSAATPVAKATTTATKAPAPKPTTPPVQYVRYETPPEDNDQNVVQKGVVPTAAPASAQDTVQIFSQQMAFLFNSTAISFNLKNPPMTISFNVSPAMATDTKWTISRNATKGADWESGTVFNVTRPDENAWFTLTVMDKNDNNSVVLQDGFGKEYGSVLSKEIVIRDPGYYLIEFKGDYVTVKTSINVPKKGNI